MIFLEDKKKEELIEAHSLDTALKKSYQIQRRLL